MAKRKPKPTMPPETLPHPEHVELLLADSEAALASMRAERDEARLEILRLQLKAKLDEAAATLERARVEAQSRARERQALAARIGQSYAICWATTALEPHTGRLVPLQKDS